MMFDAARLCNKQMNWLEEKNICHYVNNKTVAKYDAGTGKRVTSQACQDFYNQDRVILHCLFSYRPARKPTQAAGLRGFVDVDFAGGSENDITGVVRRIRLMFCDAIKCEHGGHEPAANCFDGGKERSKRTNSKGS